LEKKLTQKYDHIIIGGGIIGSLIARELSRYEGSILLLEKEEDIGMGTSSANSALVHAGYDPKPGSLKSRLNKRGNELWRELAPLLHIPFKPIGSYVVAIGAEEAAELHRLLARGKENGIPGLEIIDKETMIRREPLINPETTGALWTPTAGIIDPFRATLHAAESAALNGVEFRFETEVTGLILEGNRIMGVKTKESEILGETIINCAGLYSDAIAHMAGIHPDFKIIPRKGEYLIFDSTKFAINEVLFPVPTRGTKGILVTTTVHGNTIIGPNAQETAEKSDRSTSAEGMDYVFTHARRLVPSLDKRNVIAQFSGIRATPNTAERDFIIEIPPELEGFVHLAGIESPGLASAPAIAEYTIALMNEKGYVGPTRRDFRPEIPEKISFKRMSDEEKENIIRKDPAYGNIICRCELISEGEIRDALNSPIPARTYDAIKRRTWLGTGRCQGSFDYPKVISLIAEKHGIPLTKVTKKGAGSEFLFRPTKEVEHGTV
jgi:glycerol-3-phosphate dehydrogenase